MAVYDAVGRRNVREDRVLTNISVAWPNEGFVGERLLPTVRVRKQSDQYYVFGREKWGLEPGGDVRAPGTVANEIPGMEVSKAPYFCIEHALQIPVTDEERQNADSHISPDRDGTELVTARIMLGRELAIRDLVMTAANYAPTNVVTLAGNERWNDYVNSDPIDDFRQPRRIMHGSIFLEPNTAVIPWLVMWTLEGHPDFLERIKYSERGIVTPQLVAAILGLSRVIVPGVGYNDARMGQAESLDYVWGKDVLLAYVPPRAGLKIPAFGYEFAWVYPGGSVQEVTRWREVQRKSDLVRVGRRYDLRHVALDDNDLAVGGYLMKTVID
jgi:hypothetical protein